MSNNNNKSIAVARLNITDEDVRRRFQNKLAQPINRKSFRDPLPALGIDSTVYIGNKHHAADIENLKQCGVTAVLNCASGGIGRLPVDELQDSGIAYTFTNVRQDSYTYPILHDANGVISKHLQIARALYDQVRMTPTMSNNNSVDNDNNPMQELNPEQQHGKVLFFCVAGQNRSAALAVAVMMLWGYALDDIIAACAVTRPFILENKGFQRQLVELEAILALERQQGRYMELDNDESGGGRLVYSYATIPPNPDEDELSQSQRELLSNLVEVELLIPGLCTMEVKIPIESTIETVKACLVEHANTHLLSYEHQASSSNNNNSSNAKQHVVVGKSWVVLAHFGYDPQYDFPLETESIDLKVQLERMKTMFNLEVNHHRKEKGKQPTIKWTERCRFALVIFSVLKRTSLDKNVTTVQVPWTFVHEERPGAPATLLENNLLSTHLRAWDFIDGQAFASEQPIVFSFSPEGPRDKREFMKISTSANEAQQFYAPGEGNILGMGENAIVHRVLLRPTSATGESLASSPEDEASMELQNEPGWDAAVKRPFSLSKMLASLKDASEVGMAKRLRLANSLNSDGRVLYFYGLGLCLSANSYNLQEYKFEQVLLARYEEEFSTYTMRVFMEDYIAILDQVQPERREEVKALQAKFTIILVKSLLVSLLNAFRDLTLMGVQSFDFNHMNNVLISRDHCSVRLVDIDGNAKGSVPECIQGTAASQVDKAPHKPALDIDLNTMLPRAIQSLLLGKGRGRAFVTNTVSEIWHSKPEDAQEVIKTVVRENFFSNIIQSEEDNAKTEKHIQKVAAWLCNVVKKTDPWDKYTHDIYDAMRCIDHLPIT